MHITATKILFYGLVAIAVCYLAWFFSEIISYLIMAGVLSLIANPLCRKIDNFKIYKDKTVPSGISALITLLIVGLALLGVLALFVPALVTEINTLRGLDQARVMKNFEQPLGQLEGLYNTLNIGNGKPFDVFAEENIKKIIDAQFITGFISNIFTITSNTVVALFSIFFIAFFFLKDELFIAKSIFKLVPEKFHTQTQKILNETKVQLVGYFTGLLIQFLAVTALSAIGMWIAGIDNPLIMGLLFGVMNLIPYVGPLMANAFGVVIAITSNLYLDVYTALLPLVLKVVAVYGIVQFIDNWFLSNYIFSKSVQVHPLEIFIVILASATIGGVVGMMVAIPAYSVLRIVFKEVYKNIQKLDITIA